jgi:hypothetical protein
MPPTFVNPPPPPVGDVNGPASPESRLSDVAGSIHHTGLDLTMPVLKLSEWKALGTSAATMASAVAAQTALLGGQKVPVSAQAVQFQSPSLPIVSKLHRLYAKVDASNILSAALDMAGKLDELLKEAKGYVPGGKGAVADPETPTPKDVATTIETSGDVARFLRKQFLVNKARAVDLRTGWFGSRDQKDAAGCVGWAVADLLWRQRNQRVDMPSARFIWQGAKELDGEPRPTTMIAGAGTSLRAALRLVKQHGFALEAELPSNSNAPYPGSLEAFYETIGGERKITDFINLGNDVKNRTAWLSLGRPIVCVLRAGRNFVDAAGPHALIEPFDECDSTRFAPDDGFAHAAVIVGYKLVGDGPGLPELITALEAKEVSDPTVVDERPVQERFADFPLVYLIRNSAGPTWGDRGYAWIRHVDLFQLLIEEYGVFTSSDELAATRLKPADYKKGIEAPLARLT